MVLWKHRFRRSWYRRLLGKGVMKSLMSSPLPAADSDYREVDWLAIDLETTALSADEGEIISIGWVPIVAGRIEMAGAGEILIKPTLGVGQSAVFHQLHDSEVAAGVELCEAITQLIKLAEGKALICHHAGLDMAFLNKACRDCFGTPLVIPVADTLQLERQRLVERAEALQGDGLRLHRCRERYNLPDYPAHRAVTDAQACAELFLAWAAHRNGTRKVSFKECLRGGL